MGDPAPFHYVYSRRRLPVYTIAAALVAERRLLGAIALVTALDVACTSVAQTTAGQDLKQSMETQIIFRDSAGRELTAKELADASPTVQWEVQTGDSVPPEAMRLHNEGREAGGRGDMTTALNLLDRAHRLAPAWPYPLYDTAFTYLMMGDTTKAEQYYGQVDRMAPRGFFTAKRSLDCLRRERAGSLPAGFCMAFATVEWMTDEREKKALLESLVEKFPALPAAWKDLSVLLDDDAARLRAIDSGLAHDPDPDTKGVLLINRAMILHRRGEREEAIRILGELALDPQSTLGTEVLAKWTLTTLIPGVTKRSP